MGKNSLKIVVRGCHHLAAYRRLFDRGEPDLPPEIEAGLLPCSSKIDEPHILKLFEHGAGALLVLACPQGACHLVDGNDRAERRAAWAAQRLAEIGIEPERVRFIKVESDLEEKIDEIIKEFAQAVFELGPVPSRVRRMAGKPN